MTHDIELIPITGNDIDLEALFSDQRLAQQIRFILEAEKLKTILRMTPLLDTSRRENDAECPSSNELRQEERYRIGVSGSVC